MIAAGVDVGLEYTKIVIMRDGDVLVRKMGRSGGLRRQAAVLRLWTESLQSAGLGMDEVEKTVATGQGKTDVPFADKLIVEAVADARAARRVCPDALCVVDAGADQTRVVTLGKGSDIEEVVLNQKCMAGLGLLFRRTADRLDMTPEEIGALEGEPAGGLCVNDGCPVFAELDMLELLNRNTPKEEIARAVVQAAAVRLSAILNDKIRPAKDKTVLFGGLGKNAALVSALAARSGIGFILPDYAEFGCATGAAAVALNLSGAQN